MIPSVVVGTEWLVEAFDCDRRLLRDAGTLQKVFADLVEDLGLKPVSEPVWHTFPGEGGVTGLVALTESHLACHTYPEHGIATFNLYCCRERPEWPWDTRLRELIGAGSVTITRVERGQRRNVVSVGGAA